MFWLLSSFWCCVFQGAYVSLTFLCTSTFHTRHPSFRRLGFLDNPHLTVCAFALLPNRFTTCAPPISFRTGLSAFVMTRRVVFALGHVLSNTSLFVDWIKNEFGVPHDGIDKYGGHGKEHQTKNSVPGCLRLGFSGQKQESRESHDDQY